ncbi:Inner membrane ABC transporter permease protein YdcV [Roseovarius sp. EC-HK134]|jgi:spermidine/putrescine transport system permease protein|uniref:Inner membrane ABC transporter permease protein YdcV n=1 Tax=Roseovarius mucosus TaxID=215743 RepID=A0A1V0RQV1_9RHOB|nr:MULTISPECIES: ABC transporter permease [Roseovarius]ARE84154.1 inner membrane ABC transporter permease protein YdcV [Roseovarius mucosus]VVT06763.1 Inner membrane ABC transporter permease protein YdcV [Roseovarius sp. EC-HK134]VVT07523.1 Inner membrane ABC transporter permease protein YdcV [Roseovarius sp. EC-SD190]|tara:strand:+ start:1029 stop:1829 length:801 start_codon:yes stop_codon:yes gene_type:complete
MTGNDNRLINGALKLHIAVCVLFIFAPILGSFVFSLNSDRFPSLPLGHFSTEWYRLIWEDPFVWAGFLNTVVVGLIVAVIATVLGFGGAYTDFRYNFFGKNVYLALALLPPTIPVVIMGLAMLAFLSRVNLSGSAISIIIAHGVMCSPFAMAIIRLRLSQMDPDLEAASWNLGGNEWATLRHVIIPFTKPAIFAALFITMAVSFDEFAVAWFVSGLNETLPVKILGFLQGQVSPRINAIGSLAFLSSITLIILAQMLLRNSTKDKP